MKHKITIFTLNISKILSQGLGSGDLQNGGRTKTYAKPRVLDSAYLIGLTDSSIQRRASSDGSVVKFIEVYPENLPGDASSVIIGDNGYSDCTVEEDPATGVNFVTMYSSDEGRCKYYIRPSLATYSRDWDISVENSFTFYLNPSHITPSYKKLITESRTAGGWNVQQWGNGLAELRVQGQSGGMHKTDGGEYTSDITQSAAWKKLKELKNLYRYNNSIYANPVTLGMNYFDTFYIGYFTDFTGPEGDANSPYLVNYGFSFKVTDEFSLAQAASSIGGLQ